MREDGWEEDVRVDRRRQGRYADGAEEEDREDREEYAADSHQDVDDAKGEGRRW